MPDQDAGAAPGCQEISGTGYQDLTGKQLELAPKWFGGAGFTYTQALAGNLQLAFDGDLNYTSSAVRGYGLAYFGVQGGYAIVNSSLRLSDPAKGWVISLNGTNLGDKIT